jgi:hypothetical protein
MSRSIYIVADCFPPVAKVGIHRVSALCRHLVAAGWRVHIITARPGDDDPIDERLMSLVPPEAVIHSTSRINFEPMLARFVKTLIRRGRSAQREAPDGGSPGGGETSVAAVQLSNDAGPRGGRFRTIVDWVSWWLHVPDSRMGWLMPAMRAGLRARRTAKPEIIFSTAPAWTSHVVAAAMARLMGLPLVADFRDPWCSSAFQDWPYDAHRRVDERLEQFVLNTASSVTCAWDGIRRHLGARYPHKAAGMTTIINGFAPAQIDAVTPVRPGGVKCTLIHAGNFYGPRSPWPLMEGLKKFKRDYPQAAADVGVVLLGSTDYQGKSLEQITAKCGLWDMVRILPPCPHAQSLAMLKGADAAILFGQSGTEELASVPAKVFEYIGAGKNVLAIGAGRESLDLMRRGGCRVWAAGEADPAALCEALQEIHALHMAGKLALEPGPARLQFTQDAMAAQLSRVLEDTIDSHQRSRAPQVRRCFTHPCPPKSEQISPSPTCGVAAIPSAQDTAAAPAE